MVYDLMCDVCYCMVIRINRWMFKRSDFKPLEVLGGGKKNTKIYKAVHLATGKVYALKQIEAKNLDKLNEYKEEAMQLMKVQPHPNVIRFYGYYFSETKYNSFKLGIVTEFLDGRANLEVLYRSRKKAGQSWTEQELVTMYCSLVSTCSYLQSRGICHRDIKPANVFLLPNCEVKLIDFGESKDYFYDPTDEDRETFTLATIRGTPQYLSPILWKAHVVDGSSRFAQHNIYKSDVFSVGLVLLQLALMNQITGFNSKTKEVNGEKLLRDSFKVLQKVYSAEFAQLFTVLLRFEESERPTFCELEAIFHDKEQKGRPLNKYIRQYNEHFSNLTRTAIDSSLKSTFALQPPNEEEVLREEETEVKTSYYKDSTLMLHESCYWFEFGGSAVGRFSINRQKWKLGEGTQGKPFPLHFAVVFVPPVNSYFLLGGAAGDNFRVYQCGRKLLCNRVQMPVAKNFFPCVYHAHRVYTFGGYDGDSHTQLRASHCYDVNANKWLTIADLHLPRSQSAACRINDEEIIICGGYNKSEGTLESIERYIIAKDRIESITLKLPIPLRRFTIVRIAPNQALVLGGLTRASKESQRVFKLDYVKGSFQELENLEKGGVVESEVLADSDGSLHIFLEHANGTSPHSHIKYSYDPNREDPYETNQL